MKYMDWKDFDIKAGSRASYVVGDVVYTETVKTVEEDEETGVVTVVFEDRQQRSTVERKDS